MAWDAGEWLARFSAADSGDLARALRVEVFRSSVDILARGGYATPSGWVPLANQARTWAETAFHEDTSGLVVPPEPRGRFDTAVAVVGADALDAARVLVAAGCAPCVLNMANARNPGGGVHGGSGAQEENLFRRTTLPWSLYQFADYHAQYGVAANPQGKRYPIPADAGGVYSPHVVAFRSSEATGYGLLARPYEVAVVTVAAIHAPPCVIEHGEERLAPAAVARTLPRIRAILRIAAHHGHTDLVLGAFGCGAFHNPPRHMAELFRQTLAEPEFSGRFRIVIFAILDRPIDYTHKHGGNLLPFQEVFEVAAD